jgi:glutamate N-acetyltransferase/amino-acid N-acetyltransferase
MKNDTITAPMGFQAGAAAAGIKTTGKLDVGVLVADQVCSAAAVFTRNRFCGAPVTVGREHIRSGKLRAIVVNSGCSNVATGNRGIEDARRMCREVAARVDAREVDVLPSSTGVIGAFLPMDKVLRGIEEAMSTLASSAAAGRDFARAILTTDTRMKQACTRVRIGRARFTIAGCCKGSGMIAPNMATMLAYITTDAGISASELRPMLGTASENTFNRITVDECPSTSDTVALLASGAVGRIDTGAGLESFARALREVCEDLSYQIIADGEGATKVLEVKVQRARTQADAHAAARAIAVSPLVKTAVHGADPNWGRIVQALGATDVSFKPENVTVKLDRTVIFAKGAPSPRLDPRKLAAIMKRKHVAITIDLAAGRAGDRVLTCDLSRDYIRINADYHT